MNKTTSASSGFAPGSSAGSAMLSGGFRSLVIAMVVSLSMLAICGVQSSAIVNEEMMSKESENLMRLIRMVGDMSGTPSSELVLDAYREYEAIHQLQSSLTEDFNETSGDSDAQSEAEKKYERVNGLLQMPELQIITQNLFNVLQEDYTYMDGPLNDNLRAKLEQAIESLFGGWRYDEQAVR